MDHWSDLFPIVFFPFKIIVLGIGAYFAIKWHHDEDNRKRKQREVRARRAAMIAEGEGTVSLEPKDNGLARPDGSDRSS